MSDIKRYVCFYDTFMEAESQEDVNGEWVKYEDYAAATQWRPIETAPKGCNVWVLAFFETEHGEKMVDCVSQWEDGSWTTTWDLKVNPTHWMPLPQPPTK